MAGSDIQEQLDALRREVRALSETVTGPSREDYAQAYADQTESILLEAVERAAASSDDEGAAGAFRRKVGQAVRECMDAFRAGDVAASAAVLDALQAELDAGREPFKALWASSGAVDVLRRARAYMELDRRIRSGPEAREPNWRLMSPDQAERALAPLASSWRIRAMMLLADSPCSLAEIGRSLGMAKGHLQFHLKALTENGLVRFDRRSKIYAITDRGLRALEGVAALVEG